MEDVKDMKELKKLAIEILEEVLHAEAMSESLMVKGRMALSVLDVYSKLKQVAIAEDA